jgi:hypothetical protein
MSTEEKKKPIPWCAGYQDKPIEHEVDRLALHVLPDLDVAQRPQEAEGLDQPQDYNDHDSDVEDRLDLLIHGDVTVNQPQDQTDDHKRDD